MWFDSVSVVQLQARGLHVARHSVFSAPRKHSEQNFKSEICWKACEVTFVFIERKFFIFCRWFGYYFALVWKIDTTSLTCECSCILCPNFENLFLNNGQFFSIGDATASPASACRTLMGTGTPLIEICNELLLCNNFNDALTYLPFFIFQCCESVVLYIILLEWPASFYWNGPQVVTFL